MHQTSIHPWDKVIEEDIIFRFRPESGNRRSVEGYDKLKKNSTTQYQAMG